MGRGPIVDWQESTLELKHLYQKEVHPQRRTRLQALWQWADMAMRVPSSCSAWSTIIDARPVVWGYPLGFGQRRGKSTACHQ